VNSRPIIETKQLTRKYGDRAAVDAIDLTVWRGEIFGFLGPNGAGKTTTIRMLLGLIKPTSGTAVVAGHAPGKPEGLRKIGALMDSAFYPYLSGRANLKVLAKYDGVPDKRIDEVLEIVRMNERSSDAFKTYSLGMKQRLGVAGALLKDPDLLILDEPTNGLDPQGMAEMRDLIRELGQGERTVVLSSHLLNEIQQICDRVGIIQNGRIVTEGSVAELRGEPIVYLRADPIEKAREMLIGMVGVAKVSGRDGLLELMIPPGQAGEINRQLVTAGIVVSELRPAERSLEEVYMELTGREGGIE
jgi:ABC-type multidrug transport system ATPase subunit